MKHPSIGIYICAYNEERNIRNILRLICDQKGSSFSLEKILVISDGSTDRTAHYAQEIADRHPNIEVRNHSHNRGLTACINEALISFSTDILIKIDADVEELGSNMCEMVAQMYLNNPQAGCICFHNITTLTTTESLFARAHKHGRSMWEDLKKQVPHNTVYNVAGIIYALTKDIYINTTLPADIIDEDWYAGFSTLHNNKEIVVIDSVKVVVREETHLLRLIRQFSRHLTPQSPHLFSEDVVARAKPSIEEIKIKIFIKNMFNKPILTSTYLIVRTFGVIHSRFFRTKPHWK